MTKHMWIRWAFCPVAVMAVMTFAAAGPARADVFPPGTYDCTEFQCFVITFSADWLSSSNPTRDFTGVAHSTPESLAGFFNPAICTSIVCSPVGDPTVDMDPGDPNSQIPFVFGSQFTIPVDATHLSFDLVNTDPSGDPALSFDFFTAFTQDIAGVVLSCGGSSFGADGCGYQDGDLQIRFSAPTTVPEPSSVWLLFTAAGAAVSWRKRKIRA